MPTLTQVVLDALQSGVDPVVALQEFVEGKDDFHVPKAWCARFVQYILDKPRQAGRHDDPANAEDGHLEAAYEDRISGTVM